MMFPYLTEKRLEQCRSNMRKQLLTPFLNLPPSVDLCSIRVWQRLWLPDATGPVFL